MTDATKLAESLRAMRRNAQNHWALQREGRYSITMDSTRLGDLTDAADLIERQASELAEWRSVFGHLGATPDDCGNAIGEARRAPAVLLTDEQLRAAYFSIDSSPDHGRTGIREERLRAVQDAVLAANGKTVP